MTCGKAGPDHLCPPAGKVQPPRRAHRFPAFITRARLDGLLGECQAVKSLADLPPVA
jgi:hypothetical protein